MSDYPDNVPFSSEMWDAVAEPSNWRLRGSRRKQEKARESKRKQEKCWQTG